MKPYLLQHLLEASTGKDPDKEAVKYRDQSLTYYRLYLESNALGYHLKSLNLERGDRVGIWLEKNLAQVTSIFGILSADLVFTILNTVLHARQVRHIIQDCSIKVLIAADRMKPEIEAYRKAHQGLRIIYESQLPEIVQGNLGQKAICRNITDDNGTIIYTSGSTGLPKGIVLSHRHLLDGTRIISNYLQLSRYDRLLGLMPFNFDYGLNQLTTSIYKGASIVLLKYTLPLPFLKTMEAEQITGVGAIPTIWASVFNPKLADMKKVKREHSFHRLRYITNTGGKLPVILVKKIRETFPHTKLFLMYGLTEAFRSTYLPPEEVDRRPESIGKAIPNVRVEVIREDGRICRPGEVGELIHLGALIAKGYWNNPEKTAQVFRPNPLLGSNGFLERAVYSGDLVKRDEEGFLYYVGRKDNMIKTSGYRVSPTEVEELLLQYPGMTQAVAFGLEDENLGQKIRVVITVSQPVDMDQLLNFARQNAPHYMVPKEIFIEKSLRQLSNNKIDRPRVIRESLDKHGD